MASRVAINGFGRIGRLAFRHLVTNSYDNVEVVALNDIAPLDNLAYLLRHDSVHADPTEPIRADGDTLHWGDREFRFLMKREITELPWEELGVDIVIESTGKFTRREDAARHLEAGAGRVIVSAPSDGADLTVCLGCNEHKYDRQAHRVISNASCTTNALAVVAKVLHDRFGIVTGFLTTVHAYTSSQQLVDAPSRRWRRGRAAAANIVPTTTGAAIATTRVLTELEGRLDGLAIRVPVANGSVADLVARTEKPVTVESANDAFREAAESDAMKGILAISDEELVSSDIVGSTYSAIVDGLSTMVVGDRTVKVLAWYDNEWGYAARCADLADYIARNQ